MDFGWPNAEIGQPNAEIGQKMANCQLLFLALAVCVFVCVSAPEAAVNWWFYVA